MKEPLSWGHWTFNRDVLTLYYDSGHADYEIDLERCNSSAEVLDWICQVAGKAYVTTKDIGELVRALDDMLRPQAGLCSWGIDTPIRVTRSALLERECEVIAERIVEAAKPPTANGLPPHRTLFTLGSYLVERERAEEIVRQHPRMTFDGLVRTYRSNSDLAVAA